MVEMVGNVLLFVSALLNLELILTYHRKSHGDWRKSLMGQHAMVYMAATALILSLAAVRTIVVNWLDHTDPIWFQVLRVLTYTLLPAIFLWRRHLIVKAHREETHGSHQEAVH